MKKKNKSSTWSLIINQSFDWYNYLKIYFFIHLSFVYIEGIMQGFVHLVRMQNFPESNISYPWYAVRTCAYT